LWLAGHTKALAVLGAVKRMTWSISPAATSSYRTRPGRIGRPAASPEVQVSGRIAFDRRSQVAPDPAVHDEPPFCGYALKSSQSRHASRSTTSTCRSPDELGPPSIGASGGIGYGPGSLSSSYSNETGTFACPPGTVVYGMPIGPPFQVPEPKSALRPAVGPMLEIHAAEDGCTGSFETSVCQKASAGVIGQDGAPGTGLPSATAAGISATRTSSDAPVIRAARAIVGT
jgi:hypothetical protein